MSRVGLHRYVQYMVINWCHLRIARAYRGIILMTYVDAGALILNRESSYNG